MDGEIRTRTEDVFLRFFVNGKKRGPPLTSFGH